MMRLAASEDLPRSLALQEYFRKQAVGITRAATVGSMNLEQQWSVEQNLRTDSPQ